MMIFFAVEVEVGVEDSSPQLSGGEPRQSTRVSTKAPGSKGIQLLDALSGCRSDIQ
jgi:hypothetical protein